MTQHTPTPWFLATNGMQDGKTGIKYIAYTPDDTADNATPIAWMHKFSAQKDADAAFIVRAVNAHDALVDALKAMLLEYGGMHDEARKVEKQAVEALKLAGAA